MDARSKRQKNLWDFSTKRKFLTAPYRTNLVKVPLISINQSLQSCLATINFKSSLKRRNSLNKYENKTCWNKSSILTTQLIAFRKVKRTHNTISKTNHYALKVHDFLRDTLTRYSQNWWILKCQNANSKILRKIYKLIHIR